MRAIQIVEETGPDTALRLVELDEPEPSHMLTPGAGVVVEVHAAGVSFPEVLQTRGMYQVKPPLPFVPGSEVAGIVRSAPDGAQVKPPSAHLAASPRRRSRPSTSPSRCPTRSTSPRAQA
jgi:NADPH2:quinone reductase